MRVAAGVLLLAAVHLSRPCIREGTIMICFNVPAYFEPGPSSLLMLLKDVGEINSTVLQSENLASITRLTINDAGVTGIAEKAFSSFSNLRYLSLELNNLSQIHANWFGEPAALSELILTGNKIEVLNESTFSLLTNLTKLRLNKNMLRIIEQNSFSSQTILAELDLSENKMTWVSPQAFRSLTSTRIRLDRNPWDCSCEAEDFVAFVKDLQSRSLLDSEMHVTCESPPSLRGRPVWNISACMASPLSVTPPVGPSSTVNVATAPPTPPSPTSNPETSFKPTDAPTVPSSHAVLSLETSVHPEPTYAQTPGPASTVKVATSSSRPTSKTETSFKATDAPTVASSPSVNVATAPPTPPSPTSNPETSFKPTDAPTVPSSHAAAASSLETSVHPEPTYAQTPGPASTVKVATSSSRPPSKTETSFKATDAPTVASSLSGTHVTSPLDKTTETSVLPKFTNSPTAASKPTGVTVPSQPPSDTNTVCALVAVIAVLCVLLSVVCFLGVQRRRKRNKKTVTPEHPGDDEKQVEEESRSSHESLRSSEIVNAEATWMRSFAGIRAKSANAVILTSPFCASAKNPVTLHTEAEARAKSTEKPAEREQTMVNESEAAAAGGGIHTDNLTNTADILKENETQSNAGTNLDETPDRVPVSTDTVPYLSIGTDQNKSVPAEESTEGQRSKGGKVIKRISTWPPAAALWQQRCKRKAEGEDDGGFNVWTQDIAEKFSDEMKKIVNELGHPFSSDGSKDEDGTMKNQMEGPINLRHPQSLKPIKEEQPKKEGMAMDDPATENQNETQEHLTQNRDLTPAKKPAPNINKSSRDDRTDLKRAVHSRQRAENGASGSKAPSGGASPDDETLLSGNEYAFMNLLHEVVQNNGRWTRQRWKQTHANKQRR